MTITFQVILISAILISIIGVIGSKESDNIKNHLTAIGITSILALMTTLLYL